jgi:hypothetical protein
LVAVRVEFVDEHDVVASTKISPPATVMSVV